MAAPSTGRRRQTGRRGALGGPKPARSGTDGRIRLLRVAFLVFLVLVGGKAVALASSSQHLAQYAVDQQTADGPAAGAARLHPGQERRRARRGQAAADGVRDAVPPGRPARRGGGALRRAADQPPTQARAGREGPRRRRQGRPRLLLRRPQGRPRLRERPRSARHPRCGQLRRGGAHVSAQGHGRPGRRLRRHGQRRPGRHRAGVRRAALRQARQRDHRPRSCRARPQDRRSRSCRSPAPTSVSPSTARSSTPPRTCSRRPCRSTGGKSAMGIVMDPRTGEVLAMANVTGEGFHGFGKDQEAEQEPLHHRLLRARIDLQGRHHLRRARRRDRHARAEVHPSAQHLGLRPRDQRVAPPRHA